jgi:hypothetical protein
MAANPVHGTAPSEADPYARLSVDQVPGPANLRECRRCGLPAQEHGRTVIHRFVRPDLPAGYRYLDETGAGEERALHRRPVEQSTIVASRLGLADRTRNGSQVADA